MDEWEKAKAMANQAQWIWLSREEEDQYVLFRGDFLAKKSMGHACLSCDGNYELFLNGRLASFSQSPSYPSHPVLEQIPLEFEEGTNHFEILCYHNGSPSFSTCCPQKAALLFFFVQDDKLLCFSSASTEAAPSTSYLSGVQRKISDQLGYSVSLNLAQRAQEKFEPARLVEHVPCVWERRLSKRCELKFDHPYPFFCSSLAANHLRFDFQKEVVGYLLLDLDSPCEQNLLFTYAEHLNDGKLVHQIGNRDFSLRVHVQKGRNHFFEGFERLGLRYLEVQSEYPLERQNIQLIPFDYPFQEKPLVLADSSLQPIFDLCLRTLENCYHEHYEDCPWREQALYALDAMCQMDAGFVVFQNPEAAKSSLRLFLFDSRPDGLLSICSPSQNPLCIPSFSLYFVMALDHYVKNTGDQDFALEAKSKMDSILEAFHARKKQGLLQVFTSSNHWNFYEWEEGREGHIFEEENEHPDLLLNALYLLALESYRALYGNLSQAWKKDQAEIIQKAHEAFYDRLDNVYLDQKGGKPSLLGNSLALLSGICPKELRLPLAKKMMESPSSFSPISLSMKRFYYDALLLEVPEAKEFILKQIRRVYGSMLEQGASTCFETEKGWQDFDGAGSMCHGWSAMPLYYFWKFGLLKSEA